ncbi:putative Zn-dependent peptidase [Clostridium algifaecis]|uniref:Zn-dependent peptidase n=1 Tax=Clostridium algifaecis TaxID=1472040 RepID=A0ABS4KUD0_9CLOT|nr:pitrilysin family protein [Clostridium algifaecis]MBP2033658.1 putative Zn-dependent peptidase [Clostridium algifaecis]
MFDAVEKVLSNGIKLITIKKDTQIAALHVGIKMGSIYESLQEKGISHFIEHMLFKGTKSRSNETLNEDLENLGGEYNAYTENTSTVYSITSLGEELEKSIELLSDMVLNSKFDEHEIEKERKVILSEIKAGNDDIEQFSFRKINEIAFKNSPLKYDICGSEKTVNSFTRKDLLEFYHNYYVPNNCVISVVSSYEHEYVLNLILKYFKSWEYKKFEKRKIQPENNLPCIKTSYRRDIEQNSIVFLYTICGLNKKEELALRILNHKLGESPNSILFRKLREEKGFTYDIYTDLDLTENIKTIYIYTAVSEENIDNTINIILKCIQDIKDEKITFDDKSIDIMKKSLKTAVVFTLEDSTDIGNYVLTQCIEGQSIFKFNEDMKEIENIKNTTIYEVARKVFNDPTIYILKKHK